MKECKKIIQALGLATALFVSVPTIGLAAKSGIRRSLSDKRATGARSIRRGKSAKANQLRDDPRDLKKRVELRYSPTGGVQRRFTPGGKLQNTPSGVIVK